MLHHMLDVPSIVQKALDLIIFSAITSTHGILVHSKLDDLFKFVSIFQCFFYFFGMCCILEGKLSVSMFFFNFSAN